MPYVQQVLERLDAMDKETVPPKGRWANPLERMPVAGKFLETRRGILAVTKSPKML